MHYHYRALNPFDGLMAVRDLMSIFSPFDFRSRLGSRREMHYQYRALKRDLMSMFSLFDFRLRLGLRRED